jgi:hypothetical protein
MVWPFSRYAGGKKLPEGRFYLYNSKMSCFGIIDAAWGDKHGGKIQWYGHSRDMQGARNSPKGDFICTKVKCLVLVSSMRLGETNTGVKFKTFW